MARLRKGTIRGSGGSGMRQNQILVDIRVLDCGLLSESRPKPGHHDMEDRSCPLFHPSAGPLSRPSILVGNPLFPRRTKEQNDDDADAERRAPTLASQIDRLDALVDGFSEALSGSVGEAVQQGLADLRPSLRDAARQAVKEALADPSVWPATLPLNQTSVPAGSAAQGGPLMKAALWLESAGTRVRPELPALVAEGPRQGAPGEPGSACCSWNGPGWRC